MFLNKGHLIDNSWICSWCKFQLKCRYSRAICKEHKYRFTCMRWKDMSLGIGFASKNTRCRKNNFQVDCILCNFLLNLSTIHKDINMASKCLLTQFELFQKDNFLCIYFHTNNILLHKLHSSPHLCMTNKEKHTTHKFMQ